jgi:hypothetical protein
LPSRSMAGSIDLDGSRHRRVRPPIRRKRDGDRMCPASPSSVMTAAFDGVELGVELRPVPIKPRKAAE